MQANVVNYDDASRQASTFLVTAHANRAAKTPCYGREGALQRTCMAAEREEMLSSA